MEYRSVSVSQMDKRVDLAHSGTTRVSTSSERSIIDSDSFAEWLLSTRDILKNVTKEVNELQKGLEYINPDHGPFLDGLQKFTSRLSMVISRRGESMTPSAKISKGKEHGKQADKLVKTLEMVDCSTEMSIWWTIVK